MMPLNQGLWSLLAHSWNTLFFFKQLKFSSPRLRAFTLVNAKYKMCPTLYI